MRDYSLDLQKIGLGDKEAKVYLAALEVGQDTAQNISKRSGVNRATTYVAIKILTDLGLMSTFMKGKKQHYIASSPENLVDLYDKEKVEVEEKRAQIERLIPELLRLHRKLDEKTSVKYFEGKEALLTMAREFYKNMQGGTILNIFPPDRIREIFTLEDLEKLQANRQVKGVSVRGLYTYKDGHLPDKPDRKLRKIPHDQFPLNSDIAIYGNHVHIGNLTDKPSGVVIDDKQFAQTMRSIFDLAWEAAERYK